MLFPKVVELERIQVKSPCEPHRLSCGDPVSGALSLEGELVHDGGCGTGHVIVERTYCSHGSKLSAKRVDSLPRHPHIGIYQCQKLHVPPTQLAKVLLAAISCVGRDQGLVYA